MRAVEIYEEALSKAIGDRGGHVIGHTRSGKPIYESSHPSTANFSRKEHLEAADAHAALRTKNEKQFKMKTRRGEDDDVLDQHENAIIHHSQMAREHRESAADKR